MSNFSRRSERDKVRKEKRAAYYYDLSKLCFGGFVVSSIMQYPNLEIKSMIIFSSLGIITTWIFSLIADKNFKK